MGIYKSDAARRWANIKGFLIVAALLGGLGFLTLKAFGWLTSKAGTTPSAVRQETEGSKLMSAQLLCADAIRLSAKNPSSAKIPHPQQRGRNADGPGFVINWPHGNGLRLQNGFGAMVDTTASCTVTDGRVTRLLLDGNEML